MCFSQGTCLTLLSQAPLGVLPSHRSLSTPGSFPFTPVLGQISPPTPGQSEHQKERQCPTAHLISGCTYMNSRKHVHTHTGVRGRKKRNLLNRTVPSIKVEETVQRGRKPIPSEFPSRP